MFSSVFSYNTMHFIVSSFQGIQAVRQVIGYVLPRNMSTSKAMINFNTKHLKKGDPLPAYNGKLRLFNTRYCPFAHRAVLALNVKNIDYEVVNIDLMEKPEWLSTRSALLKVPALEVADGVSIIESLIIVEYLDDAYPEKPLLPKDPVKKAYDKMIAETCAPLIHSLFFKLVKAPELVTDDVVDNYNKALDMMQSQLQQRGTTYISGETPGYADYMIWPWIERVFSLDDERAKIDETKYKPLLEYIKKMWEDPVVKEYAIPKDIYKTFHAAFGSGKKPNYDLLLKE